MPVTPPPITWVGSHPANSYPDRRGCAPEAIVIHTMAGTLAGCDSWFAAPAANASTHYGVGRAGEIHQYLTHDRAAFANGAVEPGHTAVLIAANPSLNPNYWTIAIEHDDEGRALPPTLDQFEASARLAAWLWATVILPGGASALALDADHILRHSDISPRSRPACPGWSPELMARYLNRVRAIVAAEHHPDPAAWQDALRAQLAADLRADSLTLATAAARHDFTSARTAAQSALARIDAYA